MQPLVLRRLIRFWVRAALIAVGLAIALAALPNPSLQTQRHAPAANLFYLKTATAQRLRVEDIWQQVYQQLPDLPLENQYVNDETGDVSTNNTLVSRLIRYHIYTKGRPTAYRLDWKLTLADYLGVNERMDANTYPSGTSLRTNPMTGDMAAIRNLTRTQRDALVNGLVSIFNPAVNDPVPEPGPSVTPSPNPQPSPVPRFPRLPQPGDAQLLQP